MHVMATEAKGILICGSDFNVKLNDKLNSPSPSIRQTKTNKKINTVMREMGIIDACSDLYLAGRDYTHFSHPHCAYTWIDYFLMYNTERHRIVCCDIGNIDISDHSLLFLIINLKWISRHTLWKLNSSILSSLQIKEALEEEIQAYMVLNDTGEEEPPMLWDAFKAVMK